MEPAAAAVDHGDGSTCLHQLTAEVVPPADLGIGGQPRLEKRLALLQGDRLADGLEVIAEPTGRAAVGRAEVDCLGLAALFVGYLFLRLAEHQRGGVAVDVAAGVEGFAHQRLIGYAGTA